jgi:hypothetical protein
MEHMSYAVSLSNPANLAVSGPHSYGTGKYGFHLRAVSMADAREQVFERARADGFYGLDWSAKITRLNHLGQKEYNFADPETEIIVKLYDGPYSMFDLTGLPGEYERINYPGETDN